MPSTKKELRKFGLLVGGIFVAWAALTVWRRGGVPRAYVAGGAGSILLLLGALAPRLLAPVYALWMRLAGVLGWINTRILLGVMFFVVVTPIALVGRLFGYDPLARRERKGASRDPKAISYWIEHEDRSDPERYKRQF
jgi:hypothetical protein